MSAARPLNDDDAAASPQRTLQYLALTRLIIAISLLLAIAAFGTSIGGWTATSYVATATLYFIGAAALAVLATYGRGRLMAHVAAQITFDLILISALMVVSGGLRSGLVVLYLLPLAGASLLLPTVAVFSVCSLVVITILLDTLARALTSTRDEASLFQAGLYGAMMFAVTALLRLLAERLSTQERLAQARGRNLHSQLAINRLVIAQLEQGVVVVDAASQVRANNRAARVLFGMDPEAQLTGKRLTDIPRLAPLADQFNRWCAIAVAEDGRRATLVEVPALHLRARFVRPPLVGDDEFVIFVEDQRALDERAQQLKLASMGRLTASIAHEIRNPLAAISHASQLLLEDARETPFARLASIVRENTLRLNRLVEDILRVARREALLGDDIDLASFVPQWLHEFARDRSLPPSRVALHLPREAHVRFEPSHLRQVLYNLVDNALRYASDSNGAVQLRVIAGAEVVLWVVDDGPGVAAGAREALFEPFNTTHTKGTGLGLYLAREFCLANRCELAHSQLRLADGALREGFVLRFGTAAGATAEAADFLDTTVPYD